MDMPVPTASLSDAEADALISAMGTRARAAAAVLAAVGGGGGVCTGQLGGGGEAA